MMQEPTFLILVALSREVRHGYAIAAAVEEISSGEVKLGAGTLYTALDRMLTQGWVALDREEVERGRLRRYYRLTRDGQRVLAEEFERRHVSLSRVKTFLGGARREVKA